MGIFCWGCGYQTNDLMKEGEFDFEGYEEILPELYKDVKHKDEEGRVWYPAVINIEDKERTMVPLNTSR